MWSLMMSRIAFARCSSNIVGCLAFPPLDSLREDYEVYVVTDAALAVGRSTGLTG
jgi:hypothetical protein